MARLTGHFFVKNKFEPAENTLHLEGINPVVVRIDANSPVRFTSDVQGPGGPWF